MSRTNRSYKRGEPYKDARLFVIVCEGAVRENQYFSFYKKYSQRVKIEVLPSIEEHDGKSAPKFLLDRAAKYVEENGLTKEDFLWFVLDVDRWPETELYKLIDVCERKSNWHIAISNPCFEVWLFLHVSDISSSKSVTCKELKSELHVIIKGGYNLESFAPLVQEAITRAKGIDQNETYPYPDVKVTKVYQLMEQLLEVMKIKDF